MGEYGSSAVAQDDADEVTVSEKLNPTAVTMGVAWATVEAELDSHSNSARRLGQWEAAAFLNSKNVTDFCHQILSAKAINICAPLSQGLSSSRINNKTTWISLKKIVSLAKRIIELVTKPATAVWW